MSVKSNYKLMALKAVSWFLFIGLCFEAGAFLCYTVLTLFLKPEDADKLWKQVDLSALHAYNESYFVMLSSLTAIAAILRALMFYQIIAILSDKKLDLSQPFNEAVRVFLVKVAYIALGIGLFSVWGTKLSQNLALEGLKLPDAQDLRLGGADVWIFMGIILLVINQVFKKAIEIKNENDLTI